MRGRSVAVDATSAKNCGPAQVLFRHRGQRRRRLNRVLSVWERLGWSHGKPGLVLAALSHDLFRRSLPAEVWQWYWCLRPGFAVASRLRIRRHDAPFCLRSTVPSFPRISLA